MINAIENHYIMPYYGLFSHDLHIFGLQWRSCAHYFYVQRLIMTSQWPMMLLRMPHCGITLGNDVARAIHCDVTMGNDDIAMYTSQCKMMLL